MNELPIEKIETGLDTLLDNPEIIQQYLREKVAKLDEDDRFIVRSIFDTKLSTESQFLSFVALNAKMLQTIVNSICTEAGLNSENSKRVFKDANVFGKLEKLSFLVHYNMLQILEKMKPVRVDIEKLMSSMNRLAV